MPLVVLGQTTVWNGSAWQFLGDYRLNGFSTVLNQESVGSDGTLLPTPMTWPDWSRYLNASDLRYRTPSP